MKKKILKIIKIVVLGYVGLQVILSLLCALLHATYFKEKYGIDDVCLSLLNVVGGKGAHAKIMLPLNDEEIAKLHNSAKVLKDLISSLNI